MEVDAGGVARATARPQQVRSGAKDTKRGRSRGYGFEKQQVAKRDGSRFATRYCLSLATNRESLSSSQSHERRKSMSYANTANRANPLAALGALGVPAAFGAILVLGLAVTATVEIEDDGTRGFFLPEERKLEPPPPPPKPEPSDRAVENEAPVAQQVPRYRPTPRPDTPFAFKNSASEPIGRLPELDETIGPVDFTIPDPRPTAFDPIAAAPRGNPGGWITDADYRTIWINRGLEGTARFTLAIDASGRVSDCTITGSTGHAQLDAATCELLSRRARFEPARDANGEKVAGRFSSSVRWTIPE
jgi:protein TonB